MLHFENIHLREIRNSDAELLFNAINSPELVRFSAAYKPVHEIKHLEWMSKIIDDPTKELFIIEFSGKPVGSIQLVDINHIHRNAELTIRICDEKYRGQNIGTQAIILMSDHAYSNLGLKRLWLRVFENNIRAIKAYKKAGFIKEGQMKKAAYINGNFIDVIIMGKVYD